MFSVVCTVISIVYCSQQCVLLSGLFTVISISYCSQYCVLISALCTVGIWWTTFLLFQKSNQMQHLRFRHFPECFVIAYSFLFYEFGSDSNKLICLSYSCYITIYCVGYSCLIFALCLHEVLCNYIINGGVNMNSMIYQFRTENRNRGLIIQRKCSSILKVRRRKYSTLII